MVTSQKSEDRLIALLKSMSGLHSGKSMLAKIDLSFSQMALLRWVAQSPGCRVQEIADGLGLSAPTVSVGIRRLIKTGLLERLPDPIDKRAACVYLSKQGQALQQQFMQRRHREVRRFLSGLEHNEQEQLIDLLEKAFHSLETVETNNVENTEEELTV
ncbi:MAG: MarR family transcriptional regulator [Chloroflexi bacterium]|nr:MarR family transcriptional regulator [Chloroflexota bacterium]